MKPVGATRCLARGPSAERNDPLCAGTAAAFGTGGALSWMNQEFEPAFEATSAPGGRTSEPDRPQGRAQQTAIVGGTRRDAGEVPHLAFGAAGGSGGLS